MSATVITKPSPFYVGQRVKLNEDGVRAGLHHRSEFPDCSFEIGTVVHTRPDFGLVVVHCDGEIGNVVHRQEFWKPLTNVERS